MTKKRLDHLVMEQGFAESREGARRLILSGNVSANNRVADKPGSFFPENTRISLIREPAGYVSRGGDKLAGALESFSLKVSGCVCLDVGASTGGFTDCLLQHGAARIYAVDVGYGQLAWKLRNDPRIIAIERANIRYLPESAIPEPVDLVTVDASFISLKIVVPAVFKFMRPGADVVVLVKPQFEVGKSMVGKGGVVRDPRLHEAVLNDLTAFFSRQGLTVRAMVPSPLLGPKGNREFFMWLALVPHPS
ncbi:MAG: TlyA family rRNA (cytidine-2'-O)-methyltransferase [Desulfobacterales bacterium CG07_land_8_20_14_0_80_52_14]|nr:MAG: TlyA family rRNA (cytidine-2'-O)-methyltransferase [Desulfobacterales bacterium CG23_combo_of_CG06-09_8_20_14_all_52_9]PIU49109.1 MAG: TlyA family rRNA (cytidine-2'-O)-methyltransferase [Desulfobacterales bacterium CG07_land_8_20_14_0_80_52_14]